MKTRSVSRHPKPIVALATSCIPRSTLDLNFKLPHYRAMARLEGLFKGFTGRREEAQQG